jgi:hypothetical protein
MAFVVLIGPVWSVFVVPLHRCHCFENFANSASACAAVGNATTPSITLITCAGSPSFHHDSYATFLTPADSYTLFCSIIVTPRQSAGESWLSGWKSLSGPPNSGD